MFIEMASIRAESKRVQAQSLRARLYWPAALHRVLPFISSVEPEGPRIPFGSACHPFSELCFAFDPNSQFVSRF